MVFHSDPYSVLLVSASAGFHHAVLPLLSPGQYAPVTTVATLHEAKQYQADLVLVNAPLPDGDALSFSRQRCLETDSAVLMLIKQEQLDLIADEARSAGILLLGKPSSSVLLLQNLQALCAMRERLRNRQLQQHTVEETIEELRLVNRAKWLLITCLNMTEDEAHRYIGKLSMQQKRPKREIAESIIRTYAQ